MPRLSKIGAAALAAFGWTTGGASVSASYLVVAGGGGATNNDSGGGGAGGYRTATASLNPTLSYTVTVGAGGAGVSDSAIAGASGGDSVFSVTTSSGGGGGRSGTFAGVAGGSGGGGGWNYGTGGAGNTPSTSPAQGFAGGSGYWPGSGSPYSGGGGGGAGAVGTNATISAAGIGGVGVSSSISGTATYYAGGGGGGGEGINGGAGGLGGGGAGGRYATYTATSGTASTGGGGGGAGTGTGGNGGSGIVIVSYAGAQQFSGGVVSSSGGNTIHTFTTSGTLGPVTPLSANYLVVAGGGGGAGGDGGGGGAGGLLSGSALIIDPYSTYIVNVGSGGAGTTAGTNGVNGTNSSFSAYGTAAVGGGGGGTLGGVAGGSGGGGGAGQLASQTGGAGTSGQGNAGGTSSSTQYGGGAGGGGAGAVGSNGSGQVGGAGGIGSTSSISGTSAYYAGGGGGGSGNTSGTAGAGGNGGGGAGSAGVATATAGTANTGGGGGGGGGQSGVGNGTGNSGGSGVVIISYAGATQLMAGGVVTIAGGNVIHTFNSSGFLSPLTLLTRSLRFRSSASAYLEKTLTTPTNNKVFTWSGWIKRGIISSGYPKLFSAASSQTTNSYDTIGFEGDNIAIHWNGAGSGYLVTTAVYRDTAAWYHVCVAIDTTQATASNRCNLYVNGTQVTSFSAATYPAQNYSQLFNSAVGHRFAVGQSGAGLQYYFDGYMAEVNFIDGQALAPTAFGTVNSYGVWQPITYGGSYGTNGFYLPFTNNASAATLGNDFSGNSNTWTTNNISVTAGSTYDSMTDVPTLTSATAANYAVMNPLSATSPTIISNGNLTVATGVSGGGGAWSTIALTSGKYYFEFTATGISGASCRMGVNDSTRTNGVEYYDNGDKVVNGSQTSYGASYTDGDLIGVACDLVANTITFYKNNTSQGAISYSTWSTINMFAFCADGSGSSGITANFNFGQRPFAYTPPSGFVALNTYNL